MKIDQSQLAKKAGDKLPNHAILLKKMWYEVGEERMLGFVLACTGGVQPFVTWERSVEIGPTATGGTMQVDQCFTGHYFTDLQEALNAYEERVEAKTGAKREAEAIHAIGYEDGKTAAAWSLDTQMISSDPEEYLAYIIKGIEDVDPKIMDELPQPRLGGEIAGETTWEQICMAELERYGDDGEQELLDVYHRAFHEGVEDEIRRMWAGYNIKA